MVSKKRGKSNMKGVARESSPGYILTLIAAIINYVIAGVLFFFVLIALLIFIFVGSLEIRAFFPGFFIFFLFFLATLFVLGMGILLNVSANKMRYGTSKEIRFWSIIAIIIGVISLGNISGILALVGGIIELVRLSNRN